MPNYSRTKGAVVASQGFYVGAKNTEAVVINSAGGITSTSIVNSGIRVPVTVTFLASSGAQEVYAISPVAGTVNAVYVTSTPASLSAGYTVTHGSAGDVLASMTTTTAAKVAGYVESMTLGTVAVTAGEGISVARGTQGTAGVSTVTLVITRTS